MAEKVSRFSRRMTALLWCLGVGAIIAGLLYYEQIALLYVLATIGLVVIMLIVAFSDLEAVGRENAEGIAPKTN
jgi:choline-glycine betaine transporter